MKKSIIYVLLCFLFVSCSSGFEKKALNQCEEEFSEAFKEDEGFEIDDKEVIFSDDSLCVVKLSISQDEDVKKDFEYIYVSTKYNGKEETYQGIFDLKEYKTSLTGFYYRNVDKESLPDEALQLLMKDGKSKEEALSIMLHIGALMKCMTYGKKIEDN